MVEIHQEPGYALLAPRRAPKPICSSPLRLRAALFCTALLLGPLAAPIAVLSQQDPEPGSPPVSEGSTLEGQEPESPTEPEALSEAEDEQKKGKPRKLKRKEIRQLTEALPPAYQQWLEEVNFLITDEERAAFLSIEKDYQRDAFIERFWKIRDFYPDSPRNEFKEQWYQRLEFARQEFGTDGHDDRARLMMLNGPPTGRIVFRCTGVVFPLEIWFFDGSDQVGYEFFLIFYRKWGGQRYYLWRPSDGLEELIDNASAATSGDGIQGIWQNIYTCKDGDAVVGIIRAMTHPSRVMEQEMMLAKIERPRANPDGEWVSTFASYTTDVPEGAQTFDGELEIVYPERYKGRTVIQGTLEIPSEDVGRAQLAGYSGFNFFLTGEILKEERLFDQFRIKYDLTDAEVQGDVIPLVFERRLRPGDYKLVLRLEDLNGEGFFRIQRDLEVPLIETDVAALSEDPETRRILEQAAIAIGSDIPTLAIVEPHGTMQTGMVRFDTLTTGKGIDEVRFLLNDRVLLEKTRPPYSVEFDLGRVPQVHTLRASAHDRDGNELTSDEITINAGEHQFQVRLIEPRPGIRYDEFVDAEASVLTPEGRPVERVELFHNETLVATLYQEPWVQRIHIPNPEILSYVRAVAYLPDGNSTDHMVFINAPEYMENIDIEFVELYALVVDKDGRPQLGLEADNFTVLEDGVEQTIARFERVDNLPIHVQVMIDVSASMDPQIETTQRAALSFFQQAITPKDRGSLVTFNDHPHMAVKFTNEVDELAGGLAGLKAERGTALYDAVIFGLYYMNGLKGQRAMLILSDGKDEASRFSFDNTLEYARRAGVAIYTIGLGIDGKGTKPARKSLTQIAEETGGRSYFIDDATELGQIYEAILEELRSRYLIAYQSTNADTSGPFRTIELRSKAPGTTAKTMHGYYP